MWFKGMLVLMLAGLLAGCSGAVHQLPNVDAGNLSLAQSEVAKAGLPARHEVSDEEVQERLRSALSRIRPEAEALCQQMAVGTCQWRFLTMPNRSLNASAQPNGVVAVNRGVVEYANNEDEIALVIAHEIGHHSANHLVVGKRNQVVGAVIGAVLMGAVGALASYKSPYSGSVTEQSVRTGADLGAAVGRISFSKEQEREADYIAAVILYRSGLDLDKARGFLVTLARASGRRETGRLDSHPAGPERLAAWDKAVAEIRASGGALPKRN